MNYKEKNTKISKLLSYVLRHKPESIGIKLDDNGWTDVSELIKECDNKFTFEELEEVVRTCDKQRFKFNEDKTEIKANQGHSITVDLQLDPIAPPDKLYHGTAERFLSSIMQQGLKKMDRHHVHLYSEEAIEKATNTGARHQKGTKGVLLIIDAKRMYDDRYQFYKTDNNVYLVDAVPARFIKIG